jgi:hypothetical protein
MFVTVCYGLLLFVTVCYCLLLFVTVCYPASGSNIGCAFTLIPASYFCMNTLCSCWSLHAVKSVSNFVIR